VRRDGRAVEGDGLENR